MNTPEQPKDTPLQELSPPLRDAVVAAKTQPAPKKSQERALNRTAANRPPRSPWLRMRRELIAVTSIAAMLFLGIGLMPSPQYSRDAAPNRQLADLDLASNKRAIGIYVNPDTLAGGTVLPGSRVDVVWMRKNADGSTTEVLLGNMPVLATDVKACRDDGQTSAPRQAVVVAGTPEECLQLALAAGQGELRLVPRAAHEKGQMPFVSINSIVVSAKDVERAGLAGLTTSNTSTPSSFIGSYFNNPMSYGSTTGSSSSATSSFGGLSSLGTGGGFGGTSSASGSSVSGSGGGNRIEDHSVPGPVSAAEAIGVLNNPIATARTISAPPGSGGGAVMVVPSNPRGDFGLPQGQQTGAIDPTKMKELAEVWAYLPDKEREKIRLELSKSPDPNQRKMIQGLPNALEKDNLAEQSKPDSIPELAPADEKKDKSEGRESPVKKPETKPQVWRRQGAQPTMARVYVGDGNSLDMVSLHVNVVIDGPRARTTVDHIFRNPHGKQLEGTFEYPLPTGASPSYFAMFLGNTRDTMPPLFTNRGASPQFPASALPTLTPTEFVKHIDSTDWGRLQEARIVGKDKAKETYEDVVRGRIDPALLEYASGNTFRGRVFPIAAKGYNRVILAYEELLPLAEGQLLYRFPLPDLPVGDVQFTLTANTKECKHSALLPPDAKKESGGNQVTYSKSWKNEAPPERLVMFAGTPANPAIQAISGQQAENGPHHLFARLRPELKKIEKAKAFSSRAVFLLDTSLSESGARFNVNMKLLQKILEKDADIKEFNVLTFNVGSAWVEPKGWLTNDKAGRKKLLAKLDGIVLEGATDLDAALTGLRNPPFAVEKGTPLNVFVLSDGHITWGETDVNTLVSRYETNSPFPSRFYCYRVGMGAENAELFDALARNGGGVFNCLTEPEMNAAATAHRNMCFTVDSVRFVGGPKASDVLLAGRKVAVHPGGELVVAAKLDGPAQGKIMVEGTFQGEHLTQTFPLEIGSHSELAARAWAEVAVGSLLALNDSRLDSLVTAYCQQYGVASRAASFLVLENEADYKRLNLEEERGKTVNGDLAEYIQKLWKDLGQAKSPRVAFIEFLERIEPRVKLLQGQQGQHVQKLMALLTDREFELPPSSLHGAIIHKGDVPPAYLSERDQDRRNVAVYLKEAKRRANDGEIDGAVRVLSSVIEEHAGRGDALRLVGYRLLDLKQPDQAAHLFQQVQRQRPYEPHSYRDLARSLEDSGLYGLAAVQYEIVLAGTWHAHFHNESLKQVVQEEYARMMQDAIRKKAVGKALAEHFGERLERMTSPQPQSDLRVTISWNTDATDVDLWVIEPDGTKCFYSHNRTKNGGQLSQDQTQGYGPERYQVAKALKGEYQIKVHYYSANPNLIGGETHVNVLVTRFAGTPQETTERRTVILKKSGEEVDVCKVKY